MKKPKQPTPGSSRQGDSAKSPKSNFSLLPLGIFLVGAGVLTWLIVSSFNPPKTRLAATPEGELEATEVHRAEQPAPASVETASGGPLSDVSRQRLLGNWQRTDADYAIEIRLVNEDGSADARYFNPFNQRSIHVEKATLKELSGGDLEFFLLLQDVGYPGSTYTLRYDGENDLLTGIYYQAAMQQSFDVAFQRMRDE